ncbi:MAG: ParA family protein [Patescibacteria group bacterium]
MIISIASQKGGTGKTTTSITLSSALAISGKKVLLIDIDSQANSSKVLLERYQDVTHQKSVCATILEKKPLYIRKTTVEGLDIVPSHILLSSTDISLTTAMDHREARLKNELNKVKNRYDYIFIDCPPALSWLTLNAFTASNKLIIVASPGYFELDSINQITKTMQQVQENFNSDFELMGLLFTMSDTTINSKTSIKLLRQAYGDSVFETIIPRNTDLRDAHMDRKNIFSYAPKSTGANAYNKLAKEVFSI